MFTANAQHVLTLTSLPVYTILLYYLILQQTQHQSSLFPTASTKHHLPPFLERYLNFPPLLLPQKPDQLPRPVSFPGWSFRLRPLDFLALPLLSQRPDEIPIFNQSPRLHKFPRPASFPPFPAPVEQVFQTVYVFQVQEFRAVVAASAVCWGEEVEAEAEVLEVWVWHGVLRRFCGVWNSLWDLVSRAYIYCFVPLSEPKLGCLSQCCWDSEPAQAFACQGHEPRSSKFFFWLLCGSGSFPLY